MKFRDGYWQIKKGFSVHNAVDIRDMQNGTDTLSVYASSKKITHKGDTLNTPMLTLEYSAPAPDIIRVRVIHFKGRIKSKPSFVSLAEKSGSPEISMSENSAELRNGKLSAVINGSDGFSCTFFYDGKELTSQLSRGTGFADAEDGRHYIRQELSLSAGELVYGLGERFGAFCRNGQSVDIWNEDGGTASEQAYKNVPMYLSGRGYGVFVSHPGKVMFELGSEVVSAVQFAVEDQELDFYMIGGNTLKDVLAAYTSFSGRPALPPAWSFGLWLSTSFLPDYDEKTVSSFIDGMESRELPLSVFHFDCFWMKEFQWCDFCWNSDVFPDPAGMLQRLKNRGLRICVWINPYIAQKSPLFDEAATAGYLLHGVNGEVRQTDLWQAGMGLVDFTNPQAVSWYQGKLKNLLDMGVDCFKTDFGERIPVDVVYHDGSDPVRMHNYYAFLYNKSVFELLKKEKGSGNALVFARSAWAGSQQFPVHWGGDCTASYASMAETLRGGLSLGLAGFGFWSHDIAGFEMTATPDLYKRWAAFGLLSSHSRLHGGTSCRVPWIFDEESVDVLRHFTRLKHRLMPYLYSQAVYAAASGVPMLRAMVLEFSDDPACAYLDMQYMLGSSLLVAPVFNEEGRVRLFLPEGTWTGLLTDEIFEGGKWHHFAYDYFNMGLFVKGNSILLTGGNDRKPDYDWTTDCEIHLYCPDDGAVSCCDVVNNEGKKINSLTAIKDGNTLTLQAGNEMKASLVVLHNSKSVQCGSGTISYEKNSSVIHLTETFRSISITIDDK